MRSPDVRVNTQYAADRTLDRIFGGKPDLLCRGFLIRFRAYNSAANDAGNINAMNEHAP
jgi:hypothetical protein